MAERQTAPPTSVTSAHARGAEQDLEIFKVLVEMTDRVSQRRQANNNFYLSVNTAIVGTSAYLESGLKAWHPALVISFAGIVT